MALNAAGITSAIAALSVSGVTMVDVSSVKDRYESRDCPLFFPMPGAYIGGGSGTADNDEHTFGASGAGMWTSHRVFSYVFLYKAVGTDRTTSEVYSAAITKAEAIWTALFTLNVSGADVQTVTHEPLGVVNDPADKKFIGCIFRITMRERVNA